MGISISTIPDSIRTPGAYFDFNTKAQATGLPANAQKVLMIGIKKSALITAASFSGTGTVTASSAGTFTGSIRRSIMAVIQTAGDVDTPGTFKWSKDGGRTWDATDVAITGDAQTLVEGLTIGFSATYGFVAGDTWIFYGEPAGTHPALAPIAVYSENEAKTYFGAGSQLHRMVKAAFAANAYIDLTCIAQDEISTSDT